MEKNQIFEFKSLNGVDITAVVLDIMAPEFYQVPESKTWIKRYLCYAQNRLFYYMEIREVKLIIDKDYKPQDNEDYFYALAAHSHEVEYNNTAEDILVDYCVFPDYDSMLESYLSKKSCEEECDTLTEKKLYL